MDTFKWQMYVQIKQIRKKQTKNLSRFTKNIYYSQFNKKQFTNLNVKVFPLENPKNTSPDIDTSHIHIKKTCNVTSHMNVIKFGTDGTFILI